VNDADLAVTAAEGLVAVAATNRWITLDTAVTADKVLADARITVAHAQAALASPACTVTTRSLRHPTGPGGPRSGF
jgi:hypothetical protein